MEVTCYADGSFEPTVRLGSWAVVLRVGDDLVERSGLCPRYVTSSTAAELCAAYAGVNLARAAWPGATSVLVKTDCQVLVRAIHGTVVQQDPTMVYLLGKVRAVGLRASATWVRGHRTPGADVDAYLNDRCDRAARHELAVALGAMGWRPSSGDVATPETLLHLVRRRLEAAMRSHHPCIAVSSATRRWVGYATLMRCVALVYRLPLPECMALLRAFGIDPQQ